MSPDNAYTEQGADRTSGKVSMLEVVKYMVVPDKKLPEEKERELIRQAMNGVDWAEHVTRRFQDLVTPVALITAGLAYPLLNDPGSTHFVYQILEKGFMTWGSIFGLGLVARITEAVKGHQLNKRLNDLNIKKTNGDK